MPRFGEQLEMFSKKELNMRRPVQKGKSAGRFRREAGKTRAINIAPPPRRGGHRL